MYRRLLIIMCMVLFYVLGIFIYYKVILIEAYLWSHNTYKYRHLII